MSDAEYTPEQEVEASEVFAPTPTPVGTCARPCGCDGRCPWHGECEREVWWPDPPRPRIIPYCDVCFCGEFGDLLYPSEWDRIAARRGSDWTQAMFERCGRGSWTARHHIGLRHRPLDEA
jgi:hypothetical protein